MELLQVLTLNLCGFDPGLEAGSRLAIKSNQVIFLVPYMQLLLFISVLFEVSNETTINDLRLHGKFYVQDQCTDEHIERV